MLSPAIKAASAFALGGVGFAAANLILARNLSPQDYGQFALLLAIQYVGMPLGILGLNAAVLRHQPGPQIKLLRVSLIMGAAIGVIFAIVAWRLYAFDIVAVTMLAFAIFFGSVARMASSIFQSERHYNISLWLLQSQNFSLIAIALAASMIAGVTFLTIFSVSMVHWLVVAIVSWFLLLKVSKLKATEGWKIPWGEVPALYGYIITVEVAWQLDKLLIPLLLDIESLAAFGVLSAFVLAPFKMFQTGVGYTLIPTLKAASSGAERSSALLHEAKTSLFVVGVGSASAFLLAPRLVELFLAGKYELPMALIAASVFAGTTRILEMFISSIVTALGEPRQLMALNKSAWLALMISIAGSWYGSQWGLPGLIAGFSLGSVTKTLFAATIAVRVWNCDADLKTS